MSPSPQLSDNQPIPIPIKKGFLPSLFRGRPRSSSNASSSTHSPSTSRDVSPALSIGSSHGGGSPRLPHIVLIVDGCCPPPLSPKSRQRTLPPHHHHAEHFHSPLDPAHSHVHDGSLPSALGRSSQTPPPPHPPRPEHGSTFPQLSSSLPNSSTLTNLGQEGFFSAPPIGSTITDPFHRPKAERHATPAVVHPSPATARRGRAGTVGTEELKEKRRSRVEMKVGGWVEISEDN